MSRTTDSVDASFIRIRKAREHNLRGVSVSLPRGKLICFTGVSGSGKSSLAFDTLFAEGQRRYLESLSSYARQFLGQIARPDVDQITGLSPAIAIQQKTGGWNPRSTVGTITQINDYLRVLFARVGRQHCPRCGKSITAQTREQIVARILELPAETRVLMLAPVVRAQKGEYRDLFEDMARQGYARARVNGEVCALSRPPSLARNVRHNIEIVVDRLTITPAGRSRIAEAVEAALKLGGGTVIVQTVAEEEEGVRFTNYELQKGEARRQEGKEARRHEVKEAWRQAGKKARRGGGTEGGKDGRESTDLLLSSDYACAECGLSFEAPSPQLMSFNSPTGMCARCDGMGTTFDFDAARLVPDPRKSFLNLAVAPMRSKIGRWRRHIFEAVARHVGFDLKTPWKDLSPKARDALLYGLGETHLTFEWRWSGGIWRHGGTFAGVIAELREKHRKAGSSFVRAYYEKYMRQAPCSECRGARLNPQALNVRMAGRNIQEVSAMPVQESRQWLDGLALNATQKLIASDALKEICARLQFLCDVGLEYLTLDRAAPTLSGGEAQRIRLAGQIGAGLVGVLYVLDEPSIGLHARDNRKLLESLCRLRDLGNTVIVVEHDEETMRAADEIVDFGPGPGVRGGQIVARGDLAAVMKSKRSITGRYLRGDERIEIPAKRRPVDRPAGRGKDQRSTGSRYRKRLPS